MASERWVAAVAAADLGGLLAAHREIEFGWIRPWIEQPEERRASLKCWHGVVPALHRLLMEVDAGVMEALDRVEADGGGRGLAVRAEVGRCQGQG